MARRPSPPSTMPLSTAVYHKRRSYLSMLLFACAFFLVIHVLKKADPPATNRTPVRNTRGIAVESDHVINSRIVRPHPQPDSAADDVGGQQSSAPATTSDEKPKQASQPQSPPAPLDKPAPHPPAPNSVTAVPNQNPKITKAMQVMQKWTDRASYNQSLGQWHFPPLVHTKWNSESTIPPRARECVEGWKNKNPEATVIVWTDTDGDEFMHTYWPHLYSIYTAVPRPVMKVDLLRSALLATFGGIWSDIDACPLKPISAWPLKEGDRLVIGVEADMESDVWPNHFARKFQFLTWTFASVPGHPAMTAYLHMASRAVVARRLPSGKYHPEVSDGDVLDLTGPGQFTDAMFTYLRTWGDSSFDAMHFMEAPMRFNDAVVLPLWVFSPGSIQTGTSRPAYSRNHLDAEAMVLHLFLGSWRQGRY